MNDGQYEYDVAFSFAGADREIAKVIASIATTNGMRVFIDEHHVWEAWGKNLNEYLGEIYYRKAKYCVILISQEYCEKAYTNLERRRALDRALESRIEYILPIRLDDSWLDGLPHATAYLDLRETTPIEAGTFLVRKVRENTTPVTVPEGIATAKVVPLDPSEPAAAPVGPRPNQPIDFVHIRVADECKAWELRDPVDDVDGLFFAGGFGWYEDPIFDITIMNRVDQPVLLIAVGFEAVRLRYRGMMPLGGGGAEPITLHRIYQLELPDLWRALAEKQREVGEEERPDTVEVEERAFCRLPDPILLEAHRPYRFGLHLFDYVNFCPDDVQLYFWARTDRGEARSELAQLAYVIGSAIPPLERYGRILAGSDVVAAQRHVEWLRPEDKQRRLQNLAYELWERAGRPYGQDQEFWQHAEQELGSRLLAENDLRGVHRRPLDVRQY